MMTSRASQEFPWKMTDKARKVKYGHLELLSIFLMHVITNRHLLIISSILCKYMTGFINSKIHKGRRGKLGSVHLLSAWSY